MMAGMEGMGPLKALIWMFSFRCLAMCYHCKIYEK